MITQEEVNTLFNYDLKTGVVTNKIKRGKIGYIGRVVGSNCKGYLTVTIKGKGYRLHRLIYLLHFGFIPEIVDHIDNNPLNNRIENLRAANRNQSQRNKRISRNSTSGIKGVVWFKPSGKWRAQVKVGGKYTYLGYFKHIENAKLAVRLKRKELHGEFANHG